MALYVLGGLISIEGCRLGALVTHNKLIHKILLETVRRFPRGIAIGLRWMGYNINIISIHLSAKRDNTPYAESLHTLEALADTRTIRNISNNSKKLPIDNGHQEIYNIMGVGAQVSIGRALCPLECRLNFASTKNSRSPFFVPKLQFPIFIFRTSGQDFDHLAEISNVQPRFRASSRDFEPPAEISNVRPSFRTGQDFERPAGIPNVRPRFRTSGRDYEHPILIFPRNPGNNLSQGQCP